MKFRRADLNDIDILAEIRKKQIQDEGQKPDTDMDEDLRRFFNEKMSSGELVEWVAEAEDGDGSEHAGQIIATAAVMFMDYPPAFTNPTGRKGYVCNMYTADEYRGRGIAGALMEKLEDEARRRGLTKLVLHASKMGRIAYAKSGFEETDVVMEKTVSKA